MQDIKAENFDMSKASMEELKARIAYMEEKAKEAASAPVTITQIKVSESGMLSIYFSRHRFPSTLNIGQFDALVSGWDRVKKFVEENHSKFVDTSALSPEALAKYNADKKARRDAALAAK